MDVLRGPAFAAAALVLAAASPLPPAVGGTEVFRDNAAQTMLPALVPREALERANGRMWSKELAGNALLGPALGPS
jgi:hypothetical protein